MRRLNNWMSANLIRWPDIYAILTRLVAIVALLSIPLKHVPHRVESALPFGLMVSHTVSFFLGIALLYLASQIKMRKRNAWYLTSMVIIGLIAIELFHTHNSLQLPVYLAVLISLALSRSQFMVRSDATSMRRIVIVSSGVLVSILALVAIVFVIIDQKAFGRTLTTGQTLTITVHQLFGGSLPDGLRLRHYDLMLLHFLRTALIGAIVVVGYGMFRPLRLRRAATTSQRNQAERILSRYSDSVEDYFKIWPQDKQYYFYGDSFVAYALAGNNALVLDGASGEARDAQELRGHFLEFARLNGWMVSIIHADETESSYWQKHGLTRLFIGSEAAVDSVQFSESTWRNKHFRYINNKAHREGLSFEMWELGASVERIAELRAVSDAWLRHGNRREYRFAMGYFDSQYLRRCRIGVLKQDGKVVAYANLMPVFRENGASVDHVRSMPGASSAAMHFLLMHIILQVKQEGATVCNLGLSPLSKLDERLDHTITERLLTAIKHIGAGYYSFSGLEQFKGKFEPVWQPRYIVYQGSVTRLPQIGLALNAVTAYRTRKSSLSWRSRIWLTIMISIAGVCYASFPLAIVLNHALAWHGLVSELGASGQPYAWLFNGLDVLSSLLVCLVLTWLVVRLRHRPDDRWLYGALAAGLTASLGAAFAAIMPLPEAGAPRFSLQTILNDNMSVILHGLASFMNSAGFVVSVVLWSGYHYRRHQRRHWSLKLAVVILLLATLGTLVGWLFPESSGWLQRVFILLYAVWLIGLAHDAWR